VVLSHRVTTIAGRVTTRGRPAAASILFFAADGQAWYPQSRFFAQTMSTPDGSFRLEGLPPGAYLAAAVDKTASVGNGDEWQDPDYLETLVTRARRVTLVDGERTTLTLTVVER